MLRPIDLAPRTPTATPGPLARRRATAALAALVALPFLLIACREHSTLDVQSVEEIYCDGATVTVIASGEHILHSRSYLEHSSGRYDEVTRHTAVVRWRLPTSLDPASLPTAPIDPLSVHDLSRQHAEAHDDSGASVEPIDHRAFTGPTALLEVDPTRGQLALVPFDDPAGKPIAEARVDPLPPMFADVLVTRSARHLLAARHGQPVIVSTADLSVARELGKSPGLADFDKRYRGSEDHVRVLTDDLRYLVKVPFAAGEPQGSGHCVAVVHDLETDATTEIRLDLGQGDTAIEDLEHVGGRLLFLVDFLPRKGERQLDTKKAVVDAESKVVAWLPADPFVDNDYVPGRLFWDPARERIAAWKEAGGRNYDLKLDTLEVADHHYGSGTTVHYQLDWADTVSLLTAP